MNPKVSVCIPTYNTARYLAEAIDSVLAQEFTDYELIICDNASTDATPEICGRYTDPRIRYVRFAELTNQAGNFNRCLNEAKGEFITLLHADDWFLPGFLRDRTSRLLADPSLGFVFGGVQIADAESNITSATEHWTDDRYLRSAELLDELLFACVVPPSSLMVRNICARKAGIFRIDLTWGHDWEWVLRLAEQCTSYYVSKPLSVYRVHDASGTTEQLSAAKNGHQERQILREVFGRLSETDKRFSKLRRAAFRALSRRHMYFAEQSLLSGRRIATRNNLWYAMLADSGMLLRPTFWALLLGSVASANWYLRYRLLRDNAAIGKAAF